MPEDTDHTPRELNPEIQQRNGHHRVVSHIQPRNRLDGNRYRARGQRDGKMPAQFAQQLSQWVIPRHPCNHDQQGDQQRQADTNKDQQVARDLANEIQDIQMSSLRSSGSATMSIHRSSRAASLAAGRYLTRSINAWAAAGLATLWPLMTYR
jgi:hypothetical protein